VIIEIANPGDNTLALHRRIWLSGRYGQMVTPFQFPASAHPQGWQMRVYGAPGAAVAGSGDTFLTGDWIVNMGPARMARALAARGGH